jgi:type II secretory ATPase GspE/PulE/Tfp pilus assembly ATPase PilB-like protein
MQFYNGENSPACKISGYIGRVGLFDLIEMIVIKASMRAKGGAGS